MISSLKYLLNNDYNKKHKLFALRRFFYWKLIKLFKLTGVKYSVWGNRKIYLNSDSFHLMWLMYNYIVDWEEFNLIKDFVKPGDQLCDIGTNIGYYTIWMSKFIGPTGKIHSFEPDRVNFGRLKANVELNNLQSSVVTNNIALAETNDSLFFTTKLDGENHIDAANTGNSIEIEARRLDTYAEEHHIGRLSYAKIDVEGFEYHVLKGAESLLSNHKIDIIQLEINSTIQNAGKEVNDVLNLLDAHQYHLCRYNVDEKKLIKIEYNASRENYFAVHDIETINQQLKASGGN